jgi:RimJ/RimL family protein N-acetyltransferase
LPESDNDAKFDFEVEGILKGYAFRKGMYVDVYSMVRIKFM